MKKSFFHLHFAIFLAGFTGVLGRLITLNEYMLVWFRLLITVITLLIMFLSQRRVSNLSFKSILQITGVGLIVGLHWVSFYGSIKHANVSIALVCFSSLGFFSAVMEPLFMKRKVSPSELFLGLMAILGIYLIFHFDSKYKTGIIFGVVSAILAALFTILNKVLLDKHESTTVTLYELSGGFVVLTILMPLYLGMFNLQFEWPNSQDWLWLLILSWFCTVLAFYLSLNALKKISPFTVNLSYNLEPVYGIALAFVIFQENKYLSAGFYAGLALILVAVILQMIRVWAGVKRET